MKSFIITCTVVVSAVTGVLASPIDTERGILCPPGDHDCGHGPVCSIHDCDLCPEFPGCGTEVERSALLTKRHLECPPGGHCGHGPVCSIHDCDLCPEFPGCGTDVEPRAAFLAKRQLECPSGLDCDFAPSCTIYDCNKYPTLRGCGGEVELRSLKVERDVQTTLPAQSCALVCNKGRCLYVPEPEPEDEKRESESCEEVYVDGLRRCASASEQPLKEKRNPQDDLWCFINPHDEDVCMIPYAAAKEKRAAETDFILPCPFICNQDGCVCTAENITATAEKEKRAPATDFILPCPFICNQQGKCVCTGETEKRAIKTDSFLPYPFNCDENGTCTCHKFDGDRKCCIAPGTNTNDCIITKRDTEFVQKRDTTIIHPCPLICDENGHCACATEPTPAPSANEAMKRDTTIIHPCPLTCDENGHCACATEPIPAPSVNKAMKRNTDFIHPCPLICDENGHCACAPDSPPINNTIQHDTTYRGPPCPTGGLICNKSGCTCNGPPTVPINPPATVKRDTAFIHPCPLICDKSGHCVCAGESTAEPSVAKRDEDFYGPPCPTGGLVCDASGCRCEGPPHVPITNPPTETVEGAPEEKV